MPSDSTPLIVAVAVLLIVAAPLAMMLRTTSQRLVQRESTAEATAVYRRPSSAPVRQEQIGRRDARLAYARRLRRGYVLCVTGVITVLSAYAFMLLVRTNPRALPLTLVTLVLVAAPTVTYRLLTNCPQVAFPALPQQRASEPEPETREPQGVQARATQGTVTTEASNTRVTVASSEKRKRRKATEKSRRVNRRKR